MFTAAGNRYLRSFHVFFIGMVSVTAPTLCGMIDCGNSRDLPEAFHPVVALYDQGWRGDDEALVKFFQHIEQLEASAKEQPFARAYYGSACVARARLVADHQKPRWLRRGIGELDQAVARAPEDVGIRLLRAFTFAVLPRLAGRTETVEADFAWLVERAREGGLADGCRQAILYHAGAYALRNRDARALALLEEAAGIKGDGGIEAERIERLLRLARRQVGPSSD